jgi:energy-coupling factor transport system substrate-specific component
LYVWTVLFLIVLLLRKARSPFLWAAVSGSFGLGFGALCSIPYFITGGIPFDIIHGIGNFAVALVLFHPLYFILSKVNKRMELTY